MFYSGDVISEVNGKAVTSVRDVLDAIGLDVGKRIEFKLTRNGNKDLLVTLITAPEK